MNTDLTRYPHPSAAAYAHGCDCDPCRRRRYRQTKEYRVRVAATGLALVPAGPAGRRVRRLLAEGFSAALLAHLAGADRGTINNLARDTYPTVSRTVAERTLTLTPSRIRALAPDHMRIPAHGAARRLRALQALGWPLAEITDQLTPDELHWIVRRPTAQIPARNHRAVAAAYDRLSMRLGPSPRTAAWAQRHHIPPPLAWEDDSIDIPDARPYTPADEPDTRREDRNRLILDLTACGHSAHRIAEQLECAARTVVRVRTANSSRENAAAPVT